MIRQKTFHYIVWYFSLYPLPLSSIEKSSSHRGEKFSSPRWEELFSAEKRTPLRGEKTNYVNNLIINNIIKI